MGKRAAAKAIGGGGKNNNNNNDNKMKFINKQINKFASLTKAQKEEAFLRQQAISAKLADMKQLTARKGSGSLF